MSGVYYHFRCDRYVVMESLVEGKDYESGMCVYAFVCVYKY